MTKVIAAKIQADRTIWLLVRQMGGHAVIDNAKMSPLWDLSFGDLKDRPGEMQIMAKLLPEPKTLQTAGLIASLKLPDKGTRPGIG